eukprot:7172372-Prymnesium_polylepis.1
MEQGARPAIKRAGQRESRAGGGGPAGARRVAKACALRGRGDGEGPAGARRVCGAKGWQSLGRQSLRTERAHSLSWIRAQPPVTSPKEATDQTERAAGRERRAHEVAARLWWALSGGRGREATAARRRRGLGGPPP